MNVQTSRGKECISVLQRTDSWELSLMTKPHFGRAAAGWLKAALELNCVHAGSNLVDIVWHWFLKIITQVLQLIVFANCDRATMW